MKIAGIAILAILISGCAKIGSPTGGIKDTKPPVYLRGVPENRSTNITENEITFWFDEYIQFKDLSKELLVSPPLKEKPVVRIKDKSVRVELLDDLIPETTYTINFGKAISDLNEGNPLPDFEFVFSTGEEVDSLAVTGLVLNAFDLKPLKDAEILILLHEDLSDSAPLVRIPRYIGRANKDGLFSVNNIRPDTCRIYAIQDLNGNLKYDPGAEYMGFLDTLVVLNSTTVKPVTFIKDTLKLQDTRGKKEAPGKKSPAVSIIDTTIVQGKKLNALNLSIYYFLEETNEVYLSDRKRELAEKIFISFSRPPHDTVRMNPLNYKPAAGWFIEDASPDRDSVTYWITDSLMAKKDTLSMALSYTTTDSSGRYVLRTDTLNLRFQKPAERGGSDRKSRAVVPKKAIKKMGITPSITGKGTQNLNKAVVFTIDKPVSGVNPDSIELYLIADSTSIPQSFNLAKDTTNRRKIRLETKWIENSQYRLFLKPNAIRDIFGMTNDSLDIRFGTQKAEYYGRIILNAGGNHFPLIIQLLDPKGRIADERTILHSGKTIIDFLPPDSYTVKAIADANKNGKWDTGKYLEHRQPEKVFFYQLPVQLRSNWDYEVNWVIPD